MQTNTLVTLFKQIKGQGKVIRFGDLMKRRYNQHLIINAVKKAEVNLGVDAEGYTIISL